MTKEKALKKQKKMDFIFYVIIRNGEMIKKLLWKQLEKTNMLSDMLPMN